MSPTESLKEAWQVSISKLENSTFQQQKKLVQSIDAHSPLNLFSFHCTATKVQ